MQTDPQSHEVFKRNLRVPLRLAGLLSEGIWQMESVTVKATEKRMDGLLMRRDQEGPWSTQSSRAIQRRPSITACFGR